MCRCFVLWDFFKGYVTTSSLSWEAGTWGTLECLESTCEDASLRGGTPEICVGTWMFITLFKSYITTCITLTKMSPLHG